MSPIDIIELIVIIILICLSAFFSSAETAFTMINKMRLRSMCEEGNKGAILVSQLLENLDKILSTVLVGNNIVNISASSLATLWSINMFGATSTGVCTALLTVALLIFGEITPKRLATKNAEKIAIAYAPIIKVISIILTPVVFIIDKLAHFFLKIFKADIKGNTTSITEAELRALVAVSHEEGVIEKNEKEIINNIFDFGDTAAKDVMVPRIDMDTLDISSSFDEMMDEFRESAHSRIPVYKDNPDNIVGILHIKDLLLSKTYSDPTGHSFNISRLMRKPYFTFETQNISVLFKSMQKNATSVAIVMDEYGAVAGMITTQDLIEEIVGEIHDEYDDESDAPFVELSPGKYKIDGTYRIDDINSEIGTHLESDENESIGGLIIEQLDRFPRAGDSIEGDKVRATVMKTSNKRVESVLLELLDKENIPPRGDCE